MSMAKNAEPRNTPISPMVDTQVSIPTMIQKMDAVSPAGLTILASSGFPKLAVASQDRHKVARR